VDSRYEDKRSAGRREGKNNWIGMSMLEVGKLERWDCREVMDAAGHEVM